MQHINFQIFSTHFHPQIQLFINNNMKETMKQKKSVSLQPQMWIDL